MHKWHLSNQIYFNKWIIAEPVARILSKWKTFLSLWMTSNLVLPTPLFPFLCEYEIVEDTTYFV